MNIDQAILLAEARTKARTGEARQIRERSGFSQVETASVVGVDPATISRWEANLRRPRGAAGVRFGSFLRTLERQVLK